MPVHLSKATKHALALVAGGMTRYKASKEAGVALSTVYRAVIRQRQQEQAKQEQTK